MSVDFDAGGRDLISNGPGLVFAAAVSQKFTGLRTREVFGASPSWP